MAAPDADAEREGELLHRSFSAPAELARTDGRGFFTEVWTQLLLPLLLPLGLLAFRTLTAGAAAATVAARVMGLALFQTGCCVRVVLAKLLIPS